MNSENQQVASKGHHSHDGGNVSSGDLHALKGFLNRLHKTPQTAWDEDPQVQRLAQWLQRDTNAHPPQTTEHLSPSVPSDPQALLESSGIGFLLLDDQGRVRYYTPTLTQFYELSESDLGKPFNRIGSRIANDDAAHQLARIGETAIPDKRITGPDGNIYLRRMLPYTPSTEARAGVLLILVGITELSNAENASRLTSKGVRVAAETAKFESLGVLAGGIAHDFNNLLTGILANAGIVALETQDNPKLKELLDEIQAASRQAADLCRQMLTYAGKTDFLMAPVDLPQLTQDTIGLLERSIHKNIKISFQAAEGAGQVMADKQQMRQVLTDLILNASEAIGTRGGNIDIHLDELSVDASRIHEVDPGYQIKPGTYTALTITDDGCGISEEQMPKIFDPFFTTKFTGRGLGLAEVRGILISHGGALSVHSVPGESTTLTVMLPQTPPASIRSTQVKSITHDTAVPDRNPQPGSPKKEKVLVIDDLDCICRTLKRLLLKTGFEEIYVAMDGETGADLFKKHQDHIQVVFLDLIMPGWNGARTFSELKKINPDIPIVIMSGYIEDQAEDFKKENVRPSAFLQKPFDKAGLMVCLSEAMGSGHEQVPHAG